MQSTHLGSCLCQQIKFEITGEFESFYLCHCKHCQKDTGSAHAANLFSAMAKLTWLSGKTKVKSFNLTSTRHRRSFCADCGSALPSLQGKLLVVPAGSLDSELNKVPDAHIFCASQASWENGLEAIKCFEKFPG
jgi:hypothetical protein